MTSDAAGNIYVAGTTSSPDFHTKNAAQPVMGEGLLMRSLDQGQTWEKVPGPPIALASVIPHPADPQTLFAGAPNGIYKTMDGGKTWRHVARWIAREAVYPPAFVNLVIDPTNPRDAYAYAPEGPHGTFLVSIDGGESWRTRPTPFPFASAAGSNLLWVDPNGSGLLGLGSWISKDHGMTWIMASTPGGATYTTPDPRHTGWIFAANQGVAGGGFYVSEDYGTTWTQKSAPIGAGASEPATINDLLFDADQSSTLYADAFNRMFISSNDGGSWQAAARQPIDDGTRQALLGRQCGGGALLVLSLNSVVASFDFGTSWQPPQLTRVIDIAAGPGCAVYAVRTAASDAFVAKLGPGGRELLWSTFLGGADEDTSAAIALDNEGNVYVAGNTSSNDFPTTIPPMGPVGMKNIFAVKLNSAGQIVYSTVFGGESQEAATGMAVNANGEAYVAGWTESKKFPATRGAFQTQPGDGDGFLAKLAVDGSMVYASYLPKFATYYFDELSINPPQVVAVAAEAGGTALVGGYAGMLSRMSADGSSLTPLAAQQGQIFTMETDASGNVYVAGQSVGPGTRSGSCFEGYFFHTAAYLPPGDIFVNKLGRDDLKQVFSARLSGACQSWPGTLRIGSTGEATVGLWAFSGFPLRDPVLTSEACGGNGIATVSRLSADGSTLLASTYLDACGSAPAVALAPDGSVYAGITPVPIVGPALGNADVIKLPSAPAGAPAFNGAFNAFSGESASVVPGMLMTISGERFSSQTIQLGLDHAGTLPTELGGIQVLLDGVPIEILAVASDHLICVVPAYLGQTGAVTVQVVNGSQSSFAIPLTEGHSNVGLLTHSFPALPPAGSVDGNIRNADGTVNGPDHPAAPGSVVTLFGTGLTAPGPVPLLWNAPVCDDEDQQIEALSGTARHMAGFIDAIWAIDFQIPNGPGDGVYAVPVPGVLTRFEIGYVGSGLGVWVK
ncbi:MAG TPA: SBBP repeat-containing protein [Bryobacteraceae bacterium]|nr:SBBP repeat-containing protein [Bryobacteraceae bacterium]